MKNSQRYSLFEKQGKKWVRISEQAYTKFLAVQRYQVSLLAPILHGIGGNVKGQRELRPVKTSI